MIPATLERSRLIGTKLIRVSDREGYPFGGIGHWCPGCNSMHVFGTSSWDGVIAKPTFATVREVCARGFLTIVPATFCHYSIICGVIEFYFDCTHELAGKRAPLPDLPGHLI